MNWEALVDEAVRVCEAGIRAGQSPFAAVIARRDGAIVSAEHNTVRASCDPTAHAEVNAIRAAARVAGSIDLSGLVMFTTCEPCPMCAAAIHWARIDEIAWGATIADAEASGFHELSLPCAEVYRIGGSGVRVAAGVGRTRCAALFAQWKAGPRPEPY